MAPNVEIPESKMRPGVYALCLTFAILGMAAGPLQAQDQPKPAEFSDQAVAVAIEKGVAYLWSQQAADGSWGANFAGYTMGPTALVTYALLEAGVNPQDPRMAKTLKLLETMTDPALGADGTYSGSMAGFKTYSLGLRCNVWLSAMKSSKEYEKLLRRDVDYLMKSTADGSYWYDINGTPTPTMVAGVVQWDNSNSQYGLLGVWAGAQGGLEIPRKYWELVMKHWFDTQCSDGGWTYNGSSPTGTATMTAAGGGASGLGVPPSDAEYVLVVLSFGTGTTRPPGSVSESADPASSPAGEVPTVRSVNPTFCRETTQSPPAVTEKLAFAI
jgi:hypothetical protein